VSAYKACCLYRALKLHFTTDYDFIKYRGKVKYTVDQFNKNKQIFVYEKLSKKFSDEELKYFFIANFLQNENVWINDLLSHEAIEIYTQYSKRQQSLSYVFENDLLNIFNEEHIKNLFKCNSDDFPLLLKKLFRNEICLETLIIMNNCFPFLHKWDERIKDTIIWPKVKQKLFKYNEFLVYDKSKFKSILINSIEEYN
jgi:hypothetical protein